LVLAVRRAVHFGALLVGFSLLIWVIGVGVAFAVADSAEDPLVDPGDASRAKQLAHDFWDNPFQRLLYVATAATESTETSTCTVVAVTAYAPYGIAVDEVWVDCQGVSREAPP
jgi:hypothetical protein